VRERARAITRAAAPRDGPDHRGGRRLAPLTSTARRDGPVAGSDGPATRGADPPFDAGGKLAPLDTPRRPARAVPAVPPARGACPSRGADAAEQLPDRTGRRRL